jgi:uncharacterized protein YukE
MRAGSEIAFSREMQDLRQRLEQLQEQLDRLSSEPQPR